MILNADDAIKGTLSGLRKVLANESSLKMMRNAFISLLKNFLSSQVI